MWICRETSILLSIEVDWVICHIFQEWLLKEMNNYGAIKDLLNLKKIIEERIAFLEFSNLENIYVINKNTDNWILSKYDSCSFYKLAPNLF